MAAFATDSTITTSATWSSWNTHYYVTSSTATTTTNDVMWAAWNDTTTATSTGDTIWYYWNSSTEELQLARPPQRTPEQEAETARQQRERAAQLRQQAEEASRLAKEADARAEQLLKESLTDEQRAEFEREQHFTVISKDSQRRYRIRKGWAQNIECIDENGKRLATLCAHPVEQVPIPDNMLAQKLMLEHAEEQFLKIANRRTA